MKQLNLYTSLEADYYPLDEELNELDGISIEGSALVDYKEPIQKAVEELNKRAGNLMQYFTGSESIRKKVIKAIPNVAVRDGSLWGVTELTLKADLKESEMRELQSYLSVQYADGWGEIFETQKIALDDCNLYVHFWRDHGYTFQIWQDDELNHEEAQKQRPAMQLFGHDGNIFAILGTASRLLKQNGLENEVEAMSKRVLSAHDYYQALNIISEYVETELSEQPKKQHEKRQNGDAR